MFLVSNEISSNIWRLSIFKRFLNVHFADLQDEFDGAWTRGEVNNATWVSQQASDKTVLAYKLLLQTGRAEDPLDHGRIGCREPNLPCEKVRHLNCLFR